MPMAGPVKAVVNFGLFKRQVIRVAERLLVAEGLCPMGFVRLLIVPFQVVSRN
jgi:hypothetical protein